MRSHHQMTDIIRRRKITVLKTVADFVRFPASAGNRCHAQGDIVWTVSGKRQQTGF